MMISKTIAPIMTLAVAALALADCGSSSSCTINGVDCSVANAANSGTKTYDTNATVGYDAAAQKYTAIGSLGTYSIARSDLGAGSTYQFDLGAVPSHTIDGKKYSLAFARGAQSNFVGFTGIGSSGMFLGQSGTTVAPSVQAGKTSYTGRYNAATASGSTSSGKTTLDVDFGAGTVKNRGGSLGVNGTISGTAVTGTATFDGNSGYLKGGFYGGNELNGVATDEKNFVAVFTTTQQ